MTQVHIYTSAHQPATRFVTDLGNFQTAWEGPFKAGAAYVPDRRWTHIEPQALVATSCCRQRRWAKHCTVQVYYDSLPFWCRPGHGCRA